MQIQSHHINTKLTIKITSHNARSDMMHPIISKVFLWIE